VTIYNLFIIRWLVKVRLMSTHDLLLLHSPVNLVSLILTAFLLFVILVIFVFSTDLLNWVLIAVVLIHFFAVVF
jgi:hypothetical protein